MISQHKTMPVTGHKGYFACDGGIIALGAAITTGKTQTTLNQTEWRGDVSYSAADGPTRTLGDEAAVDIPLDKGAWVWHDGTGYLLLPTRAAVARLTLQKRKTHWADLSAVNRTNPDAKQTIVPIFELSIPHTGNNDAYGYAIRPNATPQMLAKYVDNPLFEVLANTQEVQAVQFRTGGVIQAIFYKAGEITFGEGSIAVDHPAVLMLTPQDDGWQLLVSDPLQKLPASQVQVTLSLPTTTGGKTTHAPMRIIQCDLPEIPLLGKAAVVNLKGNP
jgi:chondroitin AC lyase